MHELGITQNIVAIVSEHARERKVSKVTLQIGVLSAIVADSIRFCFDVCAQGTVVEGATLDIEMIEGVGRCNQCSSNIPISVLAEVCHCGSSDIVCIAGQELKIKEMEVD